MARIHFKSPPSPLLSQKADLDPLTICTPTQRPASCEAGKTCDCTHVQMFPLNSLVEILLIDSIANPNISHPFHLHGTVFEVVDTGVFPTQPGGVITEEFVAQWESNGRFRRNLQNPPSKDSIAIPYNGYAILRVRFTNPGYWLMHCHFMYHLLIGMSMVFQVGTEAQIAEAASIPTNFPRCGNFKPPINTVVG